MLLAVEKEREERERRGCLVQEEAGIERLEEYNTDNRWHIKSLGA